MTPLERVMAKIDAMNKDLKGTKYTMKQVAKLIENKTGVKVDLVNRVLDEETLYLFVHQGTDVTNINWDFKDEPVRVTDDTGVDQWNKVKSLLFGSDLVNGQLTYEGFCKGVLVIDGEYPSLSDLEYLLKA